MIFAPRPKPCGATPMTDAVDHATDLVERERAAIIAGRSHAPQASANECEECGLLIPSSRQLAVPGCTRCIECAENFERLRNG